MRLLFNRNIVNIAVMLWLFSGLLSCAGPGPGTGTGNAGEHKDILNIDGSVDSYCLGPHLEVFEDKGAKLTFDDVMKPAVSGMFKKNKIQIPLYGFTNSAYWFRFSMKFADKAATPWKLELAYPLMDFIDIYLVSDGTVKHIKAGYQYPFSQRGNSYRNFIFDLPRLSAVAGCYIRVQCQDRIEVPLYLWKEKAYQEKDMNETFALGIYYGLILLIIVLNLVFYISIRDRAYIYYVFYAISIAFYQLTQNGLFYKYFFPESLIQYNHYVFVPILLMEFFGLQFTIYFLNIKEYSKALYRLLNVAKTVTLLMLLLPLFISFSQAIVLILGISSIGILFVMFSGIYILIKGYWPARYFVVGWGILLTFAVVTGLKNSGYIFSSDFIAYSLHVGSSIELVILSFGLGARINVMRREKHEARNELIKTQKHMVEKLTLSREELETAHRKLSISEERYRLLVDGSHDIIFTLDKDWKFIMANEALWNFFNIGPRTLYGTVFQDQLFEGTEERATSKKFVLEKIDIFAREREPVEFRADFKSPLRGEPKEMMVSLEYITTAEGDEILGRASPVTEDALVKYVDYEKQVLTIENYLLIADDVTLKVTRSLGKFIGRVDMELLRIALREMLINAIEHGNLNITYEEKSKALEDGTYFDFVTSRQQDPRYREKKVTIEYTIDSERAVYVITDEGEGFNHGTTLSEGLSSREASREAHGRGIIMTARIFDEIMYNEKGNQVTLIKKF